jgi:hypothetical protein
MDADRHTRAEPRAERRGGGYIGRSRSVGRGTATAHLKAHAGALTPESFTSGSVADSFDEAKAAFPGRPGNAHG